MITFIYISSLTCKRRLCCISKKKSAFESTYNLLYFGEKKVFKARYQITDNYYPSEMRLWMIVFPVCFFELKKFFFNFFAESIFCFYEEIHSKATSFGEKIILKSSRSHSTLTYTSLTPSSPAHSTDEQLPSLESVSSFSTLSFLLVSGGLVTNVLRPHCVSLDVLGIVDLRL